MAIPPAGTFAYVATVPERSEETEFECRGELREPIVPTGDELWDSRLVGPAPLIRVTAAGLTPDAGPQRPWVMRSRITIRAAGHHQASAREVSFHVDQAVTSRMRPGDAWHLARTACGGLGLSVVREGTLVAAAGAVTAVPLGRTIRARIPTDLLDAAEALFHERDPAFRFHEVPVEVSVNGSSSILYGGRRTIDGYQVVVINGFTIGVPGTDECAAICNRGQCPDAAAQASAMLMADPRALSIARW